MTEKCFCFLECGRVNENAVSSLIVRTVCDLHMIILTYLINYLDVIGIWCGLNRKQKEKKNNVKLRILTLGIQLYENAKHHNVVKIVNPSFETEFCAWIIIMSKELETAELKSSDKVMHADADECQSVRKKQPTGNFFYINWRGWAWSYLNM